MVSTSSFIIVEFTSSRPFYAFWESVDLEWISTHTYSQIDEGKAILASCIISVIQDFVVAWLPFSIFLQLSISRRQKLALVAVFVGGFFSCIAGVLRAMFIYRVFYVTWDSTCMCCIRQFMEPQWLRLSYRGIEPSVYLDGDRDSSSYHLRLRPLTQGQHPSVLQTMTYFALLMPDNRVFSTNTATSARLLFQKAVSRHLAPRESEVSRPRTRR